MWTAMACEKNDIATWYMVHDIEVPISYSKEHSFCRNVGLLCENEDSTEKSLNQEVQERYWKRRSTGNLKRMDVVIVVFVVLVF